MAKAVGADEAVSDLARLHEVVLSRTDGRGADLVIESVGVASLYAEAFKLIRRGGHVAFFGIPGAGAAVPVDILQTILREDSLKGSVAGMGEDMHDALTLLAHGRFDTTSFTGSSFALDDIQMAFESVPKRLQHLKTQIVL
jgi:threonine dehydrogenase-like Zn-dependent dehydrogenase